MKWKEWLMATPIYDILGKRSYAQSGEDLIAAIELADFRLQMSDHKNNAGFYVDVGAYHPKLFSNTYLFYKKGWRGICVEPNPEMARLHRLVRSRDVFVNSGVGRKDLRSQMSDLSLEYFMFEDGAANTFSEEQAERNQKEAGRKLVRKKQIKIKTLKEILDEYVPRGQEIDLLSVDVEGMDEGVLRSSDWKKYRPKVVICEDLGFDWSYFAKATKDRHGVVGFLEDQGYRLVAKTPYSLIFRERGRC